MNNSLVRVLFSVLLIAAVAVAIYFYLQNNKLEKQVAYLRTPATDKNGCPDPCNRELKWISIREAVKMIATYGENQGSLVNKAMSEQMREMGVPASRSRFFDSRFIVFPMDTIKAMICSIDKMLNQYKPLNADNRPIRTCEVGIKYYYAAYPGLDAGDNLARTYQGRHTLVMIPAYVNSSTGAYTDFFPAATDPATRRPIELERLAQMDSSRLRRPGMPLQILTLSINDEKIGRNHGTLCPPPENCTSPLLQLADQ
jgi:hypothetical protein